MDDVAADRIVRRGAESVLMLGPERVVRDVGPAVIVGIGEAGVARQAEGEIEIAVLAGGTAVAVVADRQVLDDQLELAVDPLLLPDLLAVLGNDDGVGLGAIGDLVHHRGERALADLLDQLAGLVEHLDMGRVDLVRAAQQLAGDRDPDIAVLVDGGGGRGIEARGQDDRPRSPRAPPPWTDRA